MNTVTENLSVNVLSIFEDDRAKNSRIQVKVWNTTGRELSKFFYLNELGQRAVDAAIELGVQSFLSFTSPTEVKSSLVAHKVKLADEPKAEATFLKAKDEAAPTYTQADGTSSEVAGEIPPPIPQEALKKKRTTKAADFKAPADDEWEEVASPFKATKSEESAVGTKAEGGKVVEKVQKVVETPHIKYDKGIQEHRSTLATYLTQAHVGWKTALTPAQIQQLTTDLTGKPFMDTKGNILAEFKSDVALYF